MALLLCLLATGCSKEAKKERHLKRAQEYHHSGDYEKARIEYENVLRADAQNAAVFRGLGFIWFDRGSPIQACRYLLRARDLSPNDTEVRLKLTKALLYAGQFAQARTEALALLDADPAKGEGIVLLADIPAAEDALAETEQRLANYPQKESASFHLASASMALRKRDLPTALAALDKASAADPKSPIVHSKRGAALLLQGKVPEAGEEFRAAAELAPARTGERLRYAEFLLQTGKRDEAKAAAEALTKEAADYLPAWRLQAQIAYSEKQYDESLKLLKKVLDRDAQNIECSVLQAEVLLAKGEAKKAITVLEAQDKAFPNVPSVKYQLGRAYMQEKDLDRAAAAAREAIAGNPSYTDAILLLGQINLRTGDAQSVVGSMLGLLKNQPGLAQAQLLLVDAYRSLGNFDAAAAILRQQITADPKKGETYLLLGVVLRQQRKFGEAREAFEKAIEVAPQLEAAAYQLVELDIEQQDFGAAMQKVEQRLAKAPDSAGAHFLRGRIHAAQKQWDQAEAALQKTVELDPDFAGAYDLLISVYLAANKLDAASRQLDLVLSKNPNNPPALMLAALIHERVGDFPKARDAYETLLAVKPDAAAAQNNLAYLYAERLNDLEKAYAIGRKARAAQPENPAVADTLGWILYKRGEYQESSSLLNEAAAKMPENPEVQFHAGMASYMMGQVDAARVALQKAATAAATFPGKEEAVRRLALLEGPSAGSKELSVNELEELLQQQPQDLLARTRLAEAYEKGGEFTKAAAGYEEALKLNPKLLPVTMKLAQLYSGPVKQNEKALRYAKMARELAPDDPKVAGILGRVAYETGDATWAYSLLADSSRRLANDVSVLHSLGWAAYSLGKTEEAVRTMKKVMEAAPDSPQAADTRTFLKLVALVETGEDLESHEAEINRVLAENPQHVPALMARGALQQQRNNKAAAIATYAAVLERYPDFAPGQKRLAALYLEDPAKAAQGHELASKARKALPEDAEAMKIYAAAQFQRKDYASVVHLMRESARKAPLDAKSLYYAGLSHLQLKQHSEAREHLSAAIAAGLPDPDAKEAQRIVAELSSN